MQTLHKWNEGEVSRRWRWVNYPLYLVLRAIQGGPESWGRALGDLPLAQVLVSGPGCPVTAEHESKEASNTIDGCLLQVYRRTAYMILSDERNCAGSFF